MVGPGEVDDDLEGETQGECERFGPVRRCLIYEIKVAGALCDLPSRVFWRLFCGTGMSHFGYRYHILELA